jgi:hypothetical protein
VSLDEDRLPSRILAVAEVGQADANKPKALPRSHVYSLPQRQRNVSYLLARCGSGRECMAANKKLEFAGLQFENHCVDELDSSEPRKKQICWATIPYVKHTIVRHEWNK